MNREVEVHGRGRPFLQRLGPRTRGSEHAELPHSDPTLGLSSKRSHGWKRAVYGAAIKLQLTQEDMTRIAEFFRLLGEPRPGARARSTTGGDRGRERGGHGSIARS